MSLWSVPHLFSSASFPYLIPYYTIYPLFTHPADTLGAWQKYRRYTYIYAKQNNLIWMCYQIETFCYRKYMHSLRTDSSSLSRDEVAPVSFCMVQSSFSTLLNATHCPIFSMRRKPSGLYSISSLNQLLTTISYVHHCAIPGCQHIIQRGWINK